MDLSIQIVHYNTPKLLVETLRSIRRAAPRINYEVVVVDNNPRDRLDKSLRAQFPEVKFVVSEKHRGFGGGQNFAFESATGRHVLVFNPDIFIEYGVLEKLVEYMDDNPNIGVLGARLQNPDGTLQESCYRFNQPFVKVLRRTPLRALPFVSKMIDKHLMRDIPHDRIMDVDWLMGASLCVRREVWEELGGFDENFVLYFEDTDFCRRAWQKGKRVVYHPDIVMVHYHRREGSNGSFVAQLFHRANILHIASWLKYTKKYFRVPYPRN